MIKKLTYCLLTFLLFVACDRSKDTSSLYNEDDYKDVVLGEDLIRIGMPDKLDYLINNLVISDEMIGLLATEDKTLFDKSLLNAAENVKFYTTTKNKAVNMGVYGAELNYLIHFGQSQYSMKYMVASKQLADQIGVAMAFDQQAVEEYQTNAENRDSLISIIFGVYDNARRMLKNEEQFMLSSLVIVGSWIENMYLTTEMFSRTKSTALKSKLVTNILEQKVYMEKILEAIKLLDEGDNVFVTEIIKDLQTIDSIYVDFGDRLLSEEDVKTLNAAISQIRNNVITVN
ncbi:MAG: hypothetical protein J5588_08975 [Bacteroidales bacterium]|nr:hypothetical protein [Bacteroidales bacterium]